MTIKKNGCKNTKKLIIFPVLIISIFCLILLGLRNTDINVKVNESSEVSSDFGNDQVEKVIIEYLLTQKSFAWKISDKSSNFCAVNNLGSENAIFPLYLWVYCGEYEINGGKLEKLGGISTPIKLNYPNELSFYDPSKFTFEIPGEGSLYNDCVKRIFPEEIQQKIENYDATNLRQKVENNAFRKLQK